MLFTAPTGKINKWSSSIPLEIGPLMKVFSLSNLIVSVKPQFKHLKRVLRGPIKPDNLTMTDTVPGSKSS